MKNSIRRIKRYKYLIVVGLICTGLIWNMPEPATLLEFILHYIAFAASGLVLGYLYHLRKDYCEKHRPIIARVKGQRA